MIHVEPIVFTIRFFEEGMSYDNFDPFVAVATLQKSENKAFLSGLNGTLTKKQYIHLMKKIHEMGIEELITLRHGKEHVYDVKKLISKI